VKQSLNPQSIWIQGPAGSGKTTTLIRRCCLWLEPQSGIGQGEVCPAPFPQSGILVLAATGDNRLELADRLAAVTHGKVPFRSTTPLGWFESEVMLFWALLVQELGLQGVFPLRLAPETEQELATQCWRADLDQIVAQPDTPTERRLVRRLLDLLQLAGLAGIPLEDVPVILSQGIPDATWELPLPLEQMGELLQCWQHWCLERGFLTYGLIAGLYGQVLLPHPAYRQQLCRRYSLVLGDDLDEYPAIARGLLAAILDGGGRGIFTYNPDGAIRLGLGADPDSLAVLADRCQVEVLSRCPVAGLAAQWGETVVNLSLEPLFFAMLPESIQGIQTTARSQLLPQVAEVIITAIQRQQVQAQEIAIIAPGLDAIARYSLTEALMRHQIPVESLNDQRPLNSFPIVRALLTLLSLVYSGLGRLVDRPAIAEMLVVLSQSGEEIPDADVAPSSGMTVALIDPVRAGLLADFCFAPHPETPRLLPVQTFPRWDRLGYQAATAYENLAQWITTQQTQLEQRLIPSPIALLDRAIQQFLLSAGLLPFDQLAALRQLMETAQHYWDVNRRLPRAQRFESPSGTIVGQFIHLVQRDMVTANPYPVRPLGNRQAVTLATVFQYRASRRTHRWQFWLDSGSSRWLSGVDALFAAPLFLHHWSGQPWTTADTLAANEQRLRRILLDLLARASDRVFLCHSDLSISGQEQTGPLLSLVNLATPWQAVDAMPVPTG